MISENRSRAELMTVTELLDEADLILDIEDLLDNLSL